MRAYIITTFIGSFGVDESNKIVAFRPFPKNPEKMAEQLKNSEFEIIDEEKQLMQDLWKKKFKQFVFSYRKPDAKHIEPNNKAEQFVKDNLRKLAIDKKIVMDQVEFNQLLTKVNLELTKVKIRKAFEKDRLIVQINNSIEELDKSINILVERLREFFSLHFPEMDRVISDHRKYAEIVEKFGSREKIEDPELKQFVKKTMGTEFSQDDTRAVQLIAGEVLRLYKLREELTIYLEKLLKEIAPNFTEIATPNIAAKLISRAGGMEKLARSPSSFIQLVGAEKSLFRYLHGRGKSPRFGILVMHPLIQGAPEPVKGKIARVIASKLSIAVKMDYYSKEYKGDRLKKEVQKRVKEILSSK